MAVLQRNLVTERTHWRSGITRTPDEAYLPNPMSRLRPLLAIAACGTALAAPPPARAQDSPVARALHRTVLDNGLEVLVVENHLSPLAMVLVAVRTGAVTQEPGEQGIAHLYEHLLFRSYGDPTAFGLAVAELNGTYNGSTSDEVVTYWIAVPSRGTADAIEILARLLTRARFDRHDLQEERRVVLDEIARARSDPEQSLTREIDRRLWGDAWHRHDTQGDSASLASITLDRLRATFARYYVPNNAAVIVTGDVSAPEVLREVQRRFRDWRRGTEPPAGGPDEPGAPIAGWHATLMGNAVVRDVTVTVALRGPALHADTAATFAADALLAVLNEPSSKLQQLLVASGRFQWLRASYQTLRGPGPITITGKTTPERAEQAVNELTSVLRDADFLLDMSEEDLEIARRARRLEMALTLEAGATLAGALAGWWATAGIDYYLGYDSRLDAQTLDDIRRFADRYVFGRAGVVGVLGPPDVVQRVAQWLGNHQAGQ
jgi:zinc protease